ncbi:hybrid sensor histidine kinase/response regulator [Limnoglobus roseus]|uniref:histidine kinase n=1 Tax=Limnoglobus roseus TaxID=2598579 RepID=A0A5C1A9A7_9BACT|nr:Hpt domain-containing protein [Limnoglobus roseus]QEL13694.1 hybrid sensor histidine kinase/response regulator [Limnoglobus roseus]
MSRTVDPEILIGFLEEASGYLPAVRDGLVAVRDNPADLSAAEEAHRCVHTIKGAAAMVGLRGLSHIAYHFEEALDELVQGKLKPEPHVFPVLERGLASIEAYLDGVLGENLEEEALVAEAVQSLRTLRGLPPAESAATGAAIGGGNEWVTPYEDTEPGADDTLADLGDLAPPPFGLFAAAAGDTKELDVPSEPAADIPPELLEVFKLEADDHLRALTTLLPATRKNPADRDQWAEVRRAAHTLKGTAAMVGFANVTKLAHRMEDLLDLYFEGTRVATPGEIDALLSSTDAIEDTINGRAPDFAPLYAKLDAALAASPEVPAAPVVEAPLPQVIADEPTEKVEATPDRPQAAETYVRVPIEKLNDITKLVSELLIARTAFESRMAEFQRLLNEMEPSTTRLRRASTKLETGFEASALGGKLGTAGPDDFDDLEFDRYTELHLISRELAETTNDIQTLGTELGHVHGDFDGFLTRQGRLSTELEDKLMRLRMVPLSTTTAKLQRTVRNAAEQTSKKATLVLEGERTGLDKTVLEAMADPLLHLLRNAVDHGLETPEVRRALGKPDSGTIRLSAVHEGSQVVLRIADDGRGIDADAVRATAVARGLASAAEVDAMPVEDVHAFLFAPGFSTKAAVSELSGRGVGLDVVKSKVEALKGTVTITSQSGRGTTFTIRLPMTLAITRALMVQTNQQTFAIPLDAVEQILRFDESEVQQIGREPVLKVGDVMYPVAHLGRVLNLKQSADDTVKRPPVLLIRAGEKRLALVVEHLIGGREIVIKNLGSHLKRVPAVSGATLLGDGTVVLILNPPDLIRASAAVVAASTSQLMPRAAAPRARSATTVLLVDDSPSVRRVLTNLVERQGWKAIAAKDGTEALEILQRGQALPDVVLSDIEMPRMDGYELLGSLRNQAAFKKLPVVMITSRATEKHRRKAMDLGASAYVTKPYQDESLIDVIRQLTRSKA